MSTKTDRSRVALASMIDHTLLRPEATEAAVGALVDEGAELGVASVCVSSSMVPAAVRAAAGAVPVCSVVGFASGAHPLSVKVAEARRVVSEGAAEVDMVIDLGALKGGRWDLIDAEMEAMRAATAGVVLKVIIESAVLGSQEIVRVCQMAAANGADFVKTSTGFHPAGGATVASVALMAGSVGAEVGVKASGGIRDTASALALIDAGATRIGASATRAILDGLDLHH